MDSKRSRLELFVGCTTALAGIFAYRRLLLPPVPEAPGLGDVEQWLFASNARSPWLAVGIAAWLLARRSTAAMGLPSRSSPWASALLLAAAFGVFVWSEVARAHDLLALSLALLVTAAGFVHGGRAGCRAVTFPALVLIFTIPVPSPLRNELLWMLQRFTSDGAAWLLSFSGHEVVSSGIQIHHAGRGFLVIEACSGLRTIELLTLVSVIVRELSARDTWRGWLLVGIAPVLGFALNVARVAWIATTDDPQTRASGDHLAQGIGVLVVGSVILHGLGTILGRGGEADRAWDVRHVREVLGWRPARVFLIAAAILSTVLPDFTADRGAQHPSLGGVPLDHAGWIGIDQKPDRLFIGELPVGQVLSRRYERATRRGSSRVDVLVAVEAPGAGRGSPFSSKLATPGSDWEVASAERVRLWTLGLDAELALASRLDQRELVYSWRLRDPGFWRENLCSALACARAGDERRVFVRLSTPVGGRGPILHDRAKQTLDRFLSDFERSLSQL